MKPVNIYDPIGSFRSKNEEIEFDIAIPVPVINGIENKHRKIKVALLDKFASTVPDIPVLLVVINAKKKKHGSEETENLNVDLTCLEDTIPDTLDFSPLTFSVSNSDENFKNATRILTIIFHSDHKVEKIENCFKEYITNNLYQYYLTNGSQGEKFSDFYNTNCNDQPGIVQPETSGGAILVGV